MRLLDLQVCLDKAFYLVSERKLVGLDRYREHRLIELCEEIGDALGRSSSSVWAELVDKGVSSDFMPMIEAGW